MNNGATNMLVYGANMLVYELWNKKHVKAILDARVGLDQPRVRLAEKKRGCYYTQVRL